MVRVRKSHLYSIWLILIIILFFTNWVGLRERYITSNLTTEDVIKVGVGDLDASKPGFEVAYLTPAGVYVIGGLTYGPWENLTYWNVAWDIDPLLDLTVGDFDSQRKGDEIVVLTENGTLIQISRGLMSWEHQVIGTLPWSVPIWETHELLSGQLIVNSSTEEFAVIGEHFNWTTSMTTGHVFVAERLNNASWQINQAYYVPTSLLCGSVGDIEPTHAGDELVVAGYNTGVVSLANNNGTWSSSLVFNWEDTIRSLAIGDFLTRPIGYEIVLVKGNGIYTLERDGAVWDPTQVWVSSIMQAGIQSVIVGDLDPYNPGMEILGIGKVFENSRPILVVLAYNQLFWDIRILWNLIQPPASVATANIDFNRDGSEVIIANEPITAILSVPNEWDRTVRAGQVVLFPVIVLIPATFLLFALADYIGRVSEHRRRNYALEMVTKGYVRCPLCKRFVPKEKIEAHRRWHRRQQFR